MISVFRSHFELVGDMDRECHNAVFNRKGVLGSRSLSKAEGEASMLVLLRGGVATQVSMTADVLGKRTFTALKIGNLDFRGFPGYTQG